ncbi:MAG TPA: HEAT repeat domain-containing protein [Gemmatimonadaceae bacterium]|nr:HEAT repeat domain-containing protein [Gemmatimonadaceae bacterium]
MKSIIIGISALAAAASVHSVAPMPRPTVWPAARAGITAETAGERRLPAASWAPADPADSLWRVARQAIADEDYRRAEQLFARITEQYPKSEYAGDALYWRAWALFQLGRQQDRDAALAALDRMDQEYPDARTRRDAKDLRARLLVAQAKQGDPEAARRTTELANQLPRERGCPSEDDDMRLAALQGLMQMESESAIPILKQVLARRDACSERLRKQAVFILSQKGGDEVSSLLLEAARTDPSEEVRGEAIQWLSQTRSPRAAAALDSILTSTSDDAIRDKAIFALSQIGDERSLATLRRFAEDESRPAEARAQAVFWLGQRGGGTELGFLRDLFHKTTSEEIRSRIIQASAQSGGPEATRWLLDLARDKSAPLDARKNAIFWAAQHGVTVAELVSLYDETRGQPELQNHLIFVLSQRHDAAATNKLMDIASSDPDRDLRKQAIFWLGQKHDPRVTKFLLEIINK